MKVLTLLTLVTITALIALCTYLFLTKDGKRIVTTIAYSLLGIGAFFAVGFIALWVIVTIAPMITAIGAILATVIKGIAIVVAYAVIFQ